MQSGFTLLMGKGRRRPGASATYGSSALQSFLGIQELHKVVKLQVKSIPCVFQSVEIDSSK